MENEFTKWKAEQEAIEAQKPQENFKTSDLNEVAAEHMEAYATPSKAERAANLSTGVGASVLDDAVMAGAEATSATSNMILDWVKANPWETVGIAGAAKVANSILPDSVKPNNWVTKPVKKGLETVVDQVKGHLTDGNIPDKLSLQIDLDQTEKRIAKELASELKSKTPDINKIGSLRHYLDNVKKMRSGAGKTPQGLDKIIGEASNEEIKKHATKRKLSRLPNAARVGKNILNVGRILARDSLVGLLMERSATAAYKTGERVSEIEDEDERNRQIDYFMGSPYDPGRGL